MLRQKEDRDGTEDYSIINISSVHESTSMPLAAPYAVYPYHVTKWYW